MYLISACLCGVNCKYNGANNYNEKCNKSKKITNYYINKTNTEINSLIYIINKISSSKIIIMDNSCSNNDANYTHIKLKQDINNT